jgi:NitT/TauT family transport system permease protein
MTLLANQAAADEAALDGRAAAPRARWRIWAAASVLPMASLGVAVIVLLAWQFVPPALGVPKYIIPQVTDLLSEMRHMWLQDNLLMHIASTFSYAILGFVLGGIFGAVFGYALGLSPLWEKVLSPYLLGLQIAPKVAFAPLFIMWFGFNAWPKLIVTVLVVFFPILVNVLQSMRTVDRDLVNLARAYSMSRSQVFWKVMFPSSIPNLMAGLRIGATLAVIGITVGELVGGEIGLGYLITFGEGQADTAMVFDAILLLTVVGIAMYWAVAAVETRVLHYIPRITH